MILRLISQGLDKLIAFYQLIPLPKNCRFYPSCSCYARQALQQHTLGQAMALIVKRLLSCHPLHTGGFDPLPPSNAVQPLL